MQHTSLYSVLAHHHTTQHFWGGIHAISVRPLCYWAQHHQTPPNPYRGSESTLGQDRFFFFNVFSYPKVLIKSYIQMINKHISQDGYSVGNAGAELAALSPPNLEPPEHTGYNSRRIQLLSLQFSQLEEHRFAVQPHR